MKTRTKLVMVATGASLSLIVGGVSVASANNAPTTNAKTFVGVAGAIGIGPFAHVLSVLVANGTITQAQSDAIVKEATSERASQRAQSDANHTAHETLIATTIGSDWPTILKRLRGGESLATIAGDKKDALIAALVTEATTQLNKAVTDGRITSTQQATILANLQARVTDAVNGTGHFAGMMSGVGGMMDGLGGADRDGDMSRGPAGGQLGAGMGSFDGMASHHASGGPGSNFGGMNPGSNFVGMNN